MARQIIDSTQTLNLIPSAYDSANSVVDSVGNPTHACKNSTSTMNYSIFYLAMNLNVDTWVYYDFDYSNLPTDHVIINDVYCDFNAVSYSSSTSYIKNTYGCLSIGTNHLTPTTAFTSSTGAKRINPSYDFTVEEVSNIKLCLHGQRGSSGATSSSPNFKLYGADLYINYSIFHYEYDIAILSNTSKVTSQTTEYTINDGQTQVLTFNISNLNAVSIEDNYIDIKSQLVHTSGTTYTYTISNCDSDHIITCNDLAIEIDEDPQYTYHTVSISTINAVTDPVQGSYRYVEGQNVVIEIEANEPEMTLVRDNGIDISSQLITTSTYKTDFTTSNVSDTRAWINDGNNVWHNGNASNDRTRSTIQFNLDFDVPCLVTFYYWGTLTDNDALCFGNLNQTLLTTNYQDSSRKYWENSMSNITEENPRSVTFENVEGTNFIQVKLRRNSTTSGTNIHTAYIKLEIQPMVPETYRYTITNIQDNHSLLFVFGEVEYYIINTSSQNNDLKILPYGDWICLPGETYKVTIIPSSTISTINLIDNNVAQSNVERVEYLNENNETVVNYNYKIFNINENHTVTIEEIINNVKRFIKLNNVWNEIEDIYQKTNNNWESTSIEDLLSNISNLIIYKNN